ncbi:glycoside hydrolase family 5 protein [Dactylosporangium sp. NPDC051541]|uniref:glycoside hydrolase family 5 protein n=1 Tax=Dactylosporangium sp. NPDC051541 TaxID=3363977 RepID=UPI00379C295A
MRKPTLIAAIMGVVIMLGLAAYWKRPHTATGHEAGGLRVRGTAIVEGGGEPFVMRGISHPYAWHRERMAAFADIKRLGANTVRVVLTSDTVAQEVDTIVDRCRTSRLVCVLENHDTTGYGERAGAITLDRAADFWVGLAPTLRGTEDFVVVNLGNEPYGNGDTSGWARDTSAAIAKVRAAGVRHLIMADGPNWGQDWSKTMQSNAAGVLADDPHHNTVFSVHMYGVYDTAAKVTDYLDAFRAAGLPLVVGEFGRRHTDGPVAADAIMRAAGARGVGYLGWSWSGNSGGVEYLDAANGFDPDRLTDWGRSLFADIRATATEAATFRKASR